MTVIRRVFDIKPLPEEVADCFADWPDDKQCEFLIHVAYRLSCLGAADFDMQLCYIGQRLGKQARTETDSKRALDMLARILSFSQEGP